MLRGEKRIEKGINRSNMLRTAQYITAKIYFHNNDHDRFVEDEKSTSQAI